MNELSESSLRLLREQTLRFLKLDFLYVVALGALVSTFSLTRLEVFDLIGKFPLFIPALVILLAIDAYSDRTVVSNLILKLDKKDPNYKQRYLVIGLSIQYLAHFLFLFLVIFLLALNIRDKHFAMNYLEPYSLIQEELNKFIEKKSRLPTKKELLDYSNIAKSANKNLKGESFEIEPFQNMNYFLIFSGRDLKLGTSDDLRLIANYSLRQYINSIRNEFISEHEEKKKSK